MSQVSDVLYRMLMFIIAIVTDFAPNDLNWFRRIDHLSLVLIPTFMIDRKVVHILKRMIYMHKLTRYRCIVSRVCMQLNTYHGINRNTSKTPNLFSRQIHCGSTIRFQNLLLSKSA